MARAYCSKCAQLVRVVPGGQIAQKFSARRWYPEPHVDVAGAPCDGARARVPAGDVEFDAATGAPWPR